MASGHWQQQRIIGRQGGGARWLDERGEHRDEQLSLAPRRSHGRSEKHARPWHATPMDQIGHAQGRDLARLRTRTSYATVRHPKMLSVVVPIYKNAENISALVACLRDIHQSLPDGLEAVLVVDGSPDDSFGLLRLNLPGQPYVAQLIALSRNFGSFAAIRAGLAAARGQRIAVMAADLQEPPDLMFEFDRLLRSPDVDVVIGRRTGRADPLTTRLSAGLFWWVYRKFIQRDVPEGGVDIFGCTDRVRREIVRLGEANSSLVGLLFWIGFRRAFVPYVRRPRAAGKSAWTFGKKLRYLTDSMFGFSDLPIRLLLVLGVVGLAMSIAYAAVVVVAKLIFAIAVPGYAATVTLVSFFGGLNCAGLGLLGGYLWRTFENSKGRPNYLVLASESFNEQSHTP